MTLRVRFATSAALVAALSSVPAPAAAQEPPGTVQAPCAGVREPCSAEPQPAAAGRHGSATAPLRFFFVADVHSRHGHMQRLLAAIERERPALVVDGGDLVHDGTEAEFIRAFADRERGGVPWMVVRGNHDALLRGPFERPPPTFPAFGVAVHHGVRFILLDNHEGLLDESQFAALEAELAAHGGSRSIVVMHVPPFLEREPGVARLRHLLPFRLAETTMIDPDQVRRFTSLMERYRVLAVLAGHTHAYSAASAAGVQYIVGGAVGGLTPGLGIPNEYLDVIVDDDGIHTTRVQLRRAARDPLTFLLRAFDFYAALNDFNHRELGWTYVPSASVQLRTGIVRMESRGTERPLVSAVAAFERMPGTSGRLGFLADVGVLAGGRDGALTLAAGVRARPVGSWNRNIHVVAAANGNAGVLAGRWTAGLGVKAGVGIEWRSVTLEAGGTRATNHRATAISIGRRF